MLDVSHNQIQTIDSGCFTGEYLMQSKCFVLEIPLKFKYVLTCYVLMYVVNPFSGLKLLHFLSLDFNRILRVPQNVFEEVHNLKSLHLEYNHVNYLNESSFNGLQGM